MKGWPCTCALLAALACASHGSPSAVGQAPARRPGNPPGTVSLAALGASCPDEGCPPGLACLEYCGFAGCRSGTTFRTCEIPCKTSAQCPEGLACGNVADGPGRVCRGGARAPQPGGRGEVK